MRNDPEPQAMSAKRSLLISFGDNGFRGPGSGVRGEVSGSPVRVIALDDSALGLRVSNTPKISEFFPESGISSVPRMSFGFRVPSATRMLSRDDECMSLSFVPTPLLY